MQIHCPECGYEGEQYTTALGGFWALLARIWSQTKVTCPQCGFHKAFTRKEWEETHS